MHTLTFDSDDLDRTEDFLSRAYAKMRIGSSTPETSRARISRSGLGPITVDELDLDFDMSYAVTPLNRICLCVVHEGTIQDHVYQGVEDSFGPGDVVSFAPRPCPTPAGSAAPATTSPCWTPPCSTRWPPPRPPPRPTRCG